MLSIPLVPLIVNESLREWKDLVNTPGQCGILIALFIFFVALRFFRAGANKMLTVKLSYIDTAFILFSVFILLNSAGAGFTFWNERGLRTFLMLAGFFMLRAFLKNDDAKTVFWLVILALGAVNCLFGIAQFFGSYLDKGTLSPPRGTFGNASLFSAYIAVTLPAAYYVLASDFRKKEKLRMAAIIFLTSCAILLVVTLSRAAIVSAIVGGVYFIGRRNNFPALKLIPLLAVAVIAMCTLLYFIRPDSADGRLLIWRVSLTIWENKPLTGIGTGQFGYRFNDYQAEFFHNHRSSFEMLASNTYYAFNEYLETLVEGGLVGLVLLIVLATTAFIKMHTPAGADLSLVCCQVGILTMLTFSLLSYPFSSTALYSVFIAFLSLLACFSKTVIHFGGGAGLRNVLVYVALAGLVGVEVAAVKRYSAIKEWENAGEKIAYGDGHEALDIYAGIYPALKDHGAFLFNYGAELSELGRYDESVEILTQARRFFSHSDLYIFLGKNYEMLEDYEKAEKSYRHAALMIPNRFIPKYLLARLYIQRGDVAKACRIANEIVAMPVKVDSYTVGQIKKEMQQFLQHQPKNEDGC